MTRPEASARENRTDKVQAGETTDHSYVLIELAQVRKSLPLVLPRATARTTERPRLSGTNATVRVISWPCVPPCAPRRVTRQNAVANEFAEHSHRTASAIPMSTAVP